MPKFSVITPAYVWHDLKKEQLLRCGNSLFNQTYPDFEWVIVDDGSPLELPRFTDERISILKTPHNERICAYKLAMEKASGEIMVFLDSDDEFFSFTLEAISQMFSLGDHKMVNYSSYHVRQNFNSSVRGTFKPEKKEVGHEIFGGGNIVNGTFAFKREVYEDLGGYPEFHNPWDFSIYAQKEFPEIKPYFTVEQEGHPDGYPKELGNPWGNDFYLFYKYTRKYHSEPFEVPLIIVHHEGKKKDGHHKIS